MGTGAGWVIRRLSLTDPDPEKRLGAQAFIRSIIDWGGAFGAPAIIGSMQGRWGDGVSQEDAMSRANDQEELAKRIAKAKQGIFDDDDDVKRKAGAMNAKPA